MLLMEVTPVLTRHALIDQTFRQHLLNHLHLVSAQLDDVAVEICASSLSGGPGSCHSFRVMSSYSHSAVEVAGTLAGTTSIQRTLRSARSIRNPSAGILTATVSPTLPAPLQSLFEIAAFLSSTSPSCCRSRPVDQDCEESVIHERASVVSATG
jgi:hypothetical protein